MLLTMRRWALHIVRAAGLENAPDAKRELVVTLVERATMLRRVVEVTDKDAIQMMAATLPMDIRAERRLSERLHVSAEQVRDMFSAVSRSAWTVGEIDGLGAYR